MTDELVVQRVVKPGSYSEAWVVRDDLLPGGSKARFLPVLLRDAREVVFGGPFCGGAPVALAAVGRRLGVRVTIFYAQRQKPHQRQRDVLEYGGKIVWVKPGYMTVVQKRARDYAAQEGALFLPLGFDTPEAGKEYVRQMRPAMNRGPFDEVWCATGSGMLARCLSQAFPASRIMAVTVGLKSRWSQQESCDNVTWLDSGYAYERECRDLAPFPACPNYERKAWKLCVERGRGRILFWNVIGD